MAKTNSQPPTCDTCGAPLPTDEDGVPIYWHTFAVVNGVPHSLHICPACRDANRSREGDRHN